MGTREQKPGTGEAGAASPIMWREARYGEGVRSFHPRSQRQWQGRDSARACLSPGPGAPPALPPLVATLRPSLRPRHLSPSVCGPTPTGPSSVCKDAPSPGSSLTSSGQWHVPPSCSAPAWPPEWAVKPQTSEARPRCLLSLSHGVTIWGHQPCSRAQMGRAASIQNVPSHGREQRGRRRGPSMDDLTRQNLSCRLTSYCPKASHLAIPDSEGKGSTALCGPPAGGHHGVHCHGSCHAMKLWTVTCVLLGTCPGCGLYLLHTEPPGTCTKQAPAT